MTTTADPTLGSQLNAADLDTLTQALSMVQLGAMLTPTEWDSGAITASATVQPPDGCLSVQSCRVAASGTGASVGTYLCADSGVTPLLPPGGASTAVGIASLSADGKTITLPNSVTHVIVRYVPLPANPMSTVVATS